MLLNLDQSSAQSKQWVGKSLVKSMDPKSCYKTYLILKIILRKHTTPSKIATQINIITPTHSSNSKPWQCRKSQAEQKTDKNFTYQKLK